MCAGGVPQGTATQDEKPPSPRRLRLRWQLAVGEASLAPRKLPIQELAQGDSNHLGTRGGLGSPGSGCRGVLGAGPPGKPRPCLMGRPRCRYLVVGAGCHGIILSEEVFREG